MFQSLHACIHTYLMYSCWVNILITILRGREFLTHTLPKYVLWEFELETIGLQVKVLYKCQITKWRISYKITSHKEDKI